MAKKNSKKKKSHKTVSKKMPVSEKEAKKQQQNQEPEVVEPDVSDTTVEPAAATESAKTDVVKEKKQSNNPVAKFFRRFHEDANTWMVRMKYTPTIDESTHGVQIVPIILFTAITIMLVRMYNYKRDMSQFYWAGGENLYNQTEFFSHFKMVLIIICAVLALLIIIYRWITQSLGIKRVPYYIPMAIYAAFVIVSYIFSEYKEFAWLGWNDRFEGTLTLLCYMVMLFYIINFITSEKNVKWVVYSLAGVATILSLLGLSQALDHDFFRTAVGQKVIVPNRMTESGQTAWQLIDEAAARGEQLLGFTFQNKEIYQTVYNINYVSFYLTLMIPIFGLLFIREKNIVRKIIWGVLFGLVVFNLIGSASSGGLLGMAVVVLIAVVILNKRILQWWRPIVLMLVITIAVGGVTADRWVPEFTGAVRSVLGITEETADVPASGDAGGSSSTASATSGSSTTEGATSENQTNNGITVTGNAVVTGLDTATNGATDAQNPAPASDEPGPYKFDYFDTDGFDINFSLEGKVGKVTMDLTEPAANADPFVLKDSSGETIDLGDSDANGYYVIEHEDFDTLRLRASTDEEGNRYCTFKVDEDELEWPFIVTDDGVFLRNQLGNNVDMDIIPSIGFEGRESFGSGRGYIWSRTLPMIADNIIIGEGADTYCAYFPHKDYVGKHNIGWNPNLIVDKPHNMYFGVAVGTGVLSLITLFVLWGIYVVSSFRLYWREKYDTFISYTGLGIFLGICGFLVAGLVNDSTVSVMPMFYGLLGTGIAINLMIKRQRGLAAVEVGKKESRKNRAKKK